MRLDAQSVLTPAQYYDERHARGWMDSWPETKRKRVVDLVRAAAGEGPRRILEYGCGVAVFANAIKTAMPQWEVHGCDISPTAIARARQRCPSIEFHLLTEEGAEPPLGSDDLIYTHHVLEHVADVDETLARIARALRPGGKALHIVPCANAGSLEYRISRLNEKDSSVNGCFHLDDSSHVRRLTSAELADACRRRGLLLKKTLFANQFLGALEYLTAEYHWTLLKWLNPSQAATGQAKRKLSGLAVGIVGLSLLRRGPRYVFSLLRGPAGAGKKLLAWLAAIPAILVYPFSITVDALLRWKASREWDAKQESPNGSEMYALFERAG